MHIGIAITSLGVAGGTKCLLLLSSKLKARGHKVDLFWHSYSLKNHLKSLIFKPKLKWTQDTYVFTPLRSWSDLPKMDVMIAGPWRTAGPVYEWSQKYGGQGFYYVQHDESLWDGGQQAAQTYLLPLKKIVISTWLQKMLKEKYHQESLLCVTPVDEELFSITDSRPDRSKRILMLHHTFDWKGVGDGLEVVKQVKENDRDIQLVMIGGRERYPDLPPETEYYFQPSQKKIREIYASCGIFLCPSWYEGLGMPSMEAMATGALLVTTDTGGSRDYAIHNQTALVSPPKDKKALFENLKFALDHWATLETMRREGQDKIREYQWKDNIDRIEAEILKKTIV